MGLIRELFDEVIPLPKQSEFKFISENLMSETSKPWYAVVNLFFQVIDCVLIPGITYVSITSGYSGGILNWIIIVVCGLSSVFSISQTVYYFIFPVDKYVNPLKGRLLGETAIGAFMAAIFRIPIYMKVK
jgi:hypothetical protein